MGYNILTIDEFEIADLEFSRILSGTDINIVNVKNHINAVELLKVGKRGFDMVIWAVNDRKTQPFEQIKKFKDRNDFGKIPLIAISELTDRKNIEMAVESGVDEYIVKPFDRETVKKKIFNLLGIPYDEPIKHRIDDILSFSFSDIFNKEISAASRGNYPVSIMLITLVNNSEDNIFPERLNSAVSLSKSIIKTRLRDTDTIFHFGGNNLIIILPFSDAKGAKNVEEKIREILQSHSVLKKKNKNFKLIITDVTFPEDGKIKESLLSKLQERQNNIAKTLK